MRAADRRRSRGVPQGPRVRALAPVTAMRAPPPPPLGLMAGSQRGEGLHPSWEAKRRLKERERVGIVPGNGTKITF
jgi:hypothetical protein